MRLVTAVGPGEVELTFMWLPTWLGMHTTLKKEIEDTLRPELEGQPLTDAVLDRAHTRVLDLLEERFPEIVGLRAHLDGVRHLRFAEGP